MPVLISDAAGNIEYKSLSLKKSEAEEILLRISGEDKRSGVVTSGRKHLLVKEITINGGKKLLFGEFDSLASEKGDLFTRDISLLLDAAFMVPHEKNRISLATLVRVLADTCKEELLSLGISLDVCKRLDTRSICVPVDALIFCLSLMLRAFSTKGARIILDTAESNGGAVFSVQSEGAVADDFALVSAMLAEAAAYQGFKTEFLHHGEVKSILLYTSPTDIADYGFKAKDEKYLYKVATLCKEVIL